MKRGFLELLDWGWGYMSPFVRNIIVFNCIGFLSSLTILFEPELSRLLIDSLMNPDRSAFVFYLLMIALLQIVNLLLSQVSKVIRVHHDMIMNRTVENSITRVYLNKRRLLDKGQTVTLYKQDLPVMLQLYRSVIPGIVINIIIFALAAIRLISINFMLLIASLLFAIIPTLIVNKTGNRLSESNKRQTEIQDRYHGFISDLPHASLDSQSNESCGLFIEELNNLLSDSFKELWTYNRVQILSTTVLTLISIMGMVFTYLILGHMIFIQGFTYGQLFSVIMYTGILTTRINNVMNSYQSILTSRYSLERVREFLFDDSISCITYSPEIAKKGIEISNLSFSYSNELPLFDCLNLRVDFPSLVLLKGSNGSGKSTLINILSGITFLEGGQGSIRFDGYAKDDVYTVFQSSKTYPLRIRDNITMGIYREEFNTYGCSCFSISESDMDLICSGLSAGQEKKIVFQRMLYQDKQVLLIDEVDSSIDLEGKSRILQTLQTLKSNHIIIMAVHHDIYDDISDIIVDLDTKEDCL